MTIVAEVDQLTRRRSDLDSGELDRLLELEDVLAPQDRVSLRGLDAAESDRVHSTAHKTGDPLADYWEYRISKGLPADLDIQRAPPRSEWDKID